MCLLFILLFVLGFVIVSFSYVKIKYSYWHRCGIPYVNPIFPYGNINGPNEKQHSSITFKRYYDSYKNTSPYCGLYLFLNPLILVTDINLIKNILVKDFQYFMNRGVYHNEKDEPVTGHLFNIENQKWKDLRAKLTPTFTSGKMKFMYPTILKISEALKNCIDNELKISSQLELKEILSRFTTDVIGSCAFGLECNSLSDPTAIFRQKGRDIFESPTNSRLKSLFLLNYPNIAKKLQMLSINKDVSEFFLAVVRDTIKFREKSDIQYKDFLDLLIHLKDDKGLSLTFEEIAAQSFVFFLAGFETSSTNMTFALYELASNQRIQDKARKEVQNIFSKCNGYLTYEAIMEMSYVEQVINESLRKYPPFTNILRKVTKDYAEPITGKIFKRGTRVFIPVLAIHHDERYYPEPQKFDPERFSETEIRNRNPYCFLPFGEGPRNCIGMRFGMMQARIGLATILLNYKLTISSTKMKVPIEFKTTSVVLAIDGGLWLNVEKI